jgi:hypothetical protein
MDKDMLNDHLRLAEKHVAQGEMHITKQRIIISELERAGRNTDLALKLLDTLRQSQKIYEADRERILLESRK